LYVYGCVIALMLAVLIWAAFDIHDRIPFVMMAQAPVLLLRAIWKWRKS
jgi:hypothetical protein